MDRRRRSCDEEPAAAAGARMTSSHDQDAEADKGEDATRDCSDNHAASATARNATGKSKH